MAPKPSPKMLTNYITPSKTPQSRTRTTPSRLTPYHHFPSPDLEPIPESAAEHPIEVIGRIRDHPDPTEDPVLKFSSNLQTIRVRTEIGYRDFALDGVSNSEEEDLGGFYKRFVESRIHGVRMGGKCTIMMYGPTGSGKSHTMFGSSKHPGIVYRALKDILQAEQGGEEEEEKVGNTGFSRRCIHVTVLEIYNEEIYDLLSSSSSNGNSNNGNNGGSGKGLNFGWSSNKSTASKVRLEVMGGKAKNATFISGTEAGKISREVAKVEKRRIVKSTHCNDRSSRSHCLIILDVPWVGGRLMLVDMAGSENIELAGQTGFEAKMQTGKINQGNIALKRVVESIANGDHHVPFRDSKLTMLLQDSFEDDKSKILMVLCASPDHKEVHRTIATLEYGAKAKCIVRATNTLLPTKDRCNGEDAILGSRIAMMDEFIAKLRVENKLREKQYEEARRELIQKEEEVRNLTSKLQAKRGCEEDEIKTRVEERTRLLKLELKKCQDMMNKFMDTGVRKMEEKLLQQMEEIESLRKRLEDIEVELLCDGDDSQNDLKEGTKILSHLSQLDRDGACGLEKSMDLDLDDDVEFKHHPEIISTSIAPSFRDWIISRDEEQEDVDDQRNVSLPSKICLSTVFEEDEEDDEEVKKVIKVENTNMTSPYRPIESVEEDALTSSARQTRIQNIFMLCGNYRELGSKNNETPSSYLKNLSPARAILHKDNICSESYVSSELTKDRRRHESQIMVKEHVDDRDREKMTEVIVKWETSKEKDSGRFIQKLNISKDSSLSSLRKMIEGGNVVDENGNNDFSFLMLSGDPCGAPVAKDLENTVCVDKLPVINGQAGCLACLRRIKKVVVNQGGLHLPFSSLENKLVISPAAPCTTTPQQLFHKALKPTAQLSQHRLSPRTDENSYNGTVSLLTLSK